MPYSICKSFKSNQRILTTPDGSRTRPFETVQPLAGDLDLVVDDSIDRDDVKGAAKAAKAWAGPGNVLVCWEHGELAKIAKESTYIIKSSIIHSLSGIENGSTDLENVVGVEKFAKDVDVEHHHKIEYPGDRFDIIWTVVKPYDEIVAVTSEGIEGLDTPPTTATETK